MAEDFRRNRIADKFYTTDLITNPDKLSKELQPYLDATDLSVYTSLLLIITVIELLLIVYL